VLAIIPWILIVSCSEKGTQEKNDLMELGLKGHVQKLTELSFEGLEMKFGEVQKGDLIQTFTYHFNKKGYKIEEAMTNPNSTNIFITKYKYDNHLNLVEKFEIQTEDSALLKKSIWDYDTKDKPKSLMYYNPGNSLLWVEKYTYDRNGNSIEINGYEGDGTFNEKRISKYEKSRKIEDCDYGPNGKLKGKITYSYDDKNRPIEECRYNLKGELYYKLTTQYGRHGNILETSLSNLNMPYNYMNDLTIKKFDEKGNIIEESLYDQEGLVAYKNIFKYPLYDSKGNWLTRVRVMDVRGERTLGSSYTVKERQIEYF
jgi:hypothetical protein